MKKTLYTGSNADLTDTTPVLHAIPQHHWSQVYFCVCRRLPGALLPLCRAVWPATLPAGDCDWSVHAGGCRHLLDQALPPGTG